MSVHFTREAKGQMTRMHGYLSVINPPPKYEVSQCDRRGHSPVPYADRTQYVTFTREDVVAFSKVRYKGNNAPALRVRLTDGREVFVTASHQDEGDRKWLQKISRKFERATPSDYLRSLDAGWAEAPWMEVTL
jgi:hypothetical protein